MDFKTILEKSKEKADSVESVEAEEFDACEYYATDRIKGSLMCLDLRFADGRRKALPYSFLTGLTFDAEFGIEIYTTREKVTISGRNLTKLFDYLITYRVRYVQANIGGDTKEDGLFVGVIEVDTLEV